MSAQGSGRRRKESAGNEASVALAEEGRGPYTGQGTGKRGRSSDFGRMQGGYAENLLADARGLARVAVVSCWKTIWRCSRAVAGNVADLVWMHSRVSGL